MGHHLLLKCDGLTIEKRLWLSKRFLDAFPPNSPLHSVHGDSGHVDLEKQVVSQMPIFWSIIAKQGISQPTTATDIEKRDFLRKQSSYWLEALGDFPPKNPREEKIRNDYIFKQMLRSFAFCQAMAFESHYYKAGRLPWNRYFSEAVMGYMEGIVMLHAWREKYQSCLEQHRSYLEQHCSRLMLQYPNLSRDEILLLMKDQCHPISSCGFQFYSRTQIRPLPQQAQGLCFDSHEKKICPTQLPRYTYFIPR